MSWSKSLPKPALKEELDALLDALQPDEYMSGPMRDQLRTAKAAAKLVAHNIPGPYVNVSMNGHANGVGWQSKEGWVNDCITINVGQLTEADMKNYK